jgi:uncharacterized protein with HEPN domain
MFRSKNLAHVLTALEAVEKIFIYSQSFEDHDSFFWANEQLNYNATFNLLLVIGEETKKLEPGLKNAFSEIPWTDIASLRNHLAHNYRGIDPEILFRVVKDNLPKLKSVLIKMVSLIEQEPTLLRKTLSTEYYKNIRYLLNI